MKPARHDTHDRPDWDSYFFNIAQVVSQRSSCPSRAVGAVIVDSDTMGILATGYNGAPRGTQHCDVSCLTRSAGSDWGKCRAVHAELNAILHAARNGASTQSALMYLSTTPCVFCARTIINAGISEVRAMSKYHHENAITLLTEGGVKTVVISPVELRHLLKVWR
jgi:dCMP deaminase|tara:strand:- start:1601 stop:2095 length:495 start_codon:yes stop_codon:yes gene_type:complete